MCWCVCYLSPCHVSCPTFEVVKQYTVYTAKEVKVTHSFCSLDRKGTLPRTAVSSPSCATTGPTLAPATITLRSHRTPHHTPHTSHTPHTPRTTRTYTHHAPHTTRPHLHTYTVSLPSCSCLRSLLVFFFFFPPVPTRQEGCHTFFS